MQQLLDNAISLAELVGGEKLTSVGKNCFEHSIGLTEILQTINIDKESLVAATLYPTVKYADLKLEDVSEQFGPRVSKLIEDTLQLDSISELHKYAGQKDQQHPRMENLRKMALTMVNDVRAVLIKLAERLYILRNIKTFATAEKVVIAKEIAAIYAPLANRLGLGEIKWEMEDLAFRYLEPEQYKKISQELNQKRVDRERYVQAIIQNLTNKLLTIGSSCFQITGRPKHIYSIYRKMVRKKLPLHEIYDMTALRVLVNSVEDCYKVLSVVDTAWDHITKEFDDYIAKPKPNGYQSIHTVIVGPEQRNVEIQVRTFAMHEQAELGGAAHWVYKEGGKNTADFEAKITWLRQVMEWEKEIAAEDLGLDEAGKIFADRVYVFTPVGDVVDLPQGATPLDFAYHIHSEIGHRCRGAKVNGNIVPLTYQAQTGDRIEILTTKQSNPSRDWLNPERKFLVSSQAKAKIHLWFKRKDQIAKAPEQDKPAPKPRVINKPKSTAVAGKIMADVVIKGIDNIMFNLARCCQPVGGDDIIGYITREKGVSIHRKTCFNIARVSKLKPEKLVDVEWKK
jgi:GTP pyrophosphokinase